MTDQGDHRAARREYQAATLSRAALPPDPWTQFSAWIDAASEVGAKDATAMALAQQGVQVAVCARGLEALKATAQEIKEATGSQVISIRADMTSAEDIKMLVFSTVQALGEIDILVNNAVNSTSGRASELSDEVWLNHIQTKVMGTIVAIAA